MFKSIAVRKSQGTQYIADLRVAKPVGFRGKPVISDAACASGCQACQSICPTQAIQLLPVQIEGCYGIDIVASPRHADGRVLSGPITRNMTHALQICWDTIPEPKLVIAVGTCGISGGVFADSDALDRQFLDRFKPSLYVPGCPAHPLTFISDIMDLLGISGEVETSLSQGAVPSGVDSIGWMAGEDCQRLFNNSGCYPNTGYSGLQVVRRQCGYELARRFI